MWVDEREFFFFIVEVIILIRIKMKIMMVDVIRKEIVDRFGVKIKNEIFILGYV